MKRLRSHLIHPLLLVLTMLAAQSLLLHHESAQPDHDRTQFCEFCLQANALGSPQVAHTLPLAQTPKPNYHYAVQATTVFPSIQYTPFNPRAPPSSL